MSKAKHTPGPWCLSEIVGDRFTKTQMRRVRSTSEGTEHGAVCEVYGINDGSVAAANAKLIIAAPEMLASVKLFRDTIEYLIKADRVAGDDEGARLKSFTLESVEGLIAKAEGRS